MPASSRFPLLRGGVIGSRRVFAYYADSRPTTDAAAGNTTSPAAGRDAATADNRATPSDPGPEARAAARARE